MFGAREVLPLLLFFGLVYGDRNILQWNGWNPIGNEGMTTNRFVNYQVPQTSDAQSDGDLVCYDASLDIICIISNEIHLYCYTNQLQSVLNDFIYRDSIVCSTEFHYIIYMQGNDNDNSSLIRFNLDTATQSFNLPIASDPYSASYSYSGRRWMIDDSLGLFYTVATTSTSYQSGPLISSSTETGAIVTTSNSIVPAQYGTGFSFSPMQIAFDQTIMALQTDQTISLFDASSLLLRCTIPYHATVRYANTDGTYLFISYDAGSDMTDFYAFDSSCNFLWRIPFTDSSRGLSFSYTTDGYLFIVSYGPGIYTGDGTSDVYKVKAVDGTISGQCTTDNDGYLFGGSDNIGNTYFYDVSTTTYKLYLKQYSAQINCKVETSQSIKLDADIDWYTFVSLIKGGAFLIVASYDTDPVTHITGKDGSFFMITAANTSGQELNNILSWCVFGVSLFVALVLLAKHSCCGEDPKGWNKKKILDVLGLLLTATCLIIITITSAYVQYGIVEDINAQTAIFDESTTSFFTDNLEPCNAPTMTSTSLDYCTCNDEDEIFRQQGCIANACSEAYLDSCSQLLADSCNCSNSFYQWNCECQYGDNDTCSSIQDTTSSINQEANRQWLSCKSAYFYPTLLLRVTLWAAIISACIILLLNALQILAKFDVVALDVITTCFSLFSAFLVFLLLIIGNFMASRAGGDCISEFAATLPGCMLNSAGLALSSNEAITQANLHASYRDLLISPFILVVAAIPDLLSCCFCCPSNGVCKSRRGYDVIY